MNTVEVVIRLWPIELGVLTQTCNSWGPKLIVEMRLQRSRMINSSDA